MYEWFKAFHVISVISWVAGLLYLPRLFVYHCECEISSRQSETFKIMERRLLKAIMTPAMLSSWVFGLAMIWSSGFELVSGEIWFMIKLGLVAGLTVFHFFAAKLAADFAQDRNIRPAIFFRVVNEVPTVVMIVVVILVIVKPF